MIMRYVTAFLHQEVPQSGRAMPAYYRQALIISEIVLAVYFAIGAGLIAITTGKLEWIPVLTVLAAGICLYYTGKINPRVNLACDCGIIVIWLTWFVQRFGWTAGCSSILVPILSLAFFNLYETPRGKIAYFLGIVVFRIALFAYSLGHVPMGSMGRTQAILFQIINSLIPLLILANNYMLFSSSIQANERELMLHNQTLHKEAGTDPLTSLPNRRAMLDVIEAFQRAEPGSIFSVAIADIDFFKKINDTYGHNCGDHTLRELAKLFLMYAGQDYKVCRWGGEEFFFFLPNLNLDQAGIKMIDLHTAVGKLPMRYEGKDYAITVTIGLEEYDFQSSLEQILDRADRKLYMGKVGGRDRVVI